MSAALTTPDMDMRSLDGFLLNTERLLASELWALTRHCPEAFRGAAGLWCRAWKQIPPASLPDNDEVLAAFADMPLARFKKFRDLVMRGFELCDDGRFYHRTLAEEANRVWPSILKTRTERQADKERLKRWRENKRNAERNASETVDETPTERRTSEIEGTLKGTELKKKENISSLRSDTATGELPVLKPRRKARTALPLEFPLGADLAWAENHWRSKKRDDLIDHIPEQIQGFRDYHTSHDTRSADWPASWRTWAQNAVQFNRGHTNGRQSAHSKAVEGFGLWLESEAQRDRGDPDETLAALPAARPDA